MFFITDSLTSASPWISRHKPSRLDQIRKTLRINHTGITTGLPPTYSVVSFVRYDGFPRLLETEKQFTIFVLGQTAGYSKIRNEHQVLWGAQVYVIACIVPHKASSEMPYLTSFLMYTDNQRYSLLTWGRVLTKNDQITNFNLTHSNLH